MTMNKVFSNQEPLEPSEQNKPRVDFRNADHALHIQSFYAWLHPDLRDLPGIAWTELPGTVTSYLVNAVGDSPYAPHIALAVGMKGIGQQDQITLMNRIDPKHRSGEAGMAERSAALETVASTT